MKISAKLHGVSEVKRHFRELATLLGPALNESVKRSAEPTLALTKANAPVRSGRLKRDLILRRLKGSAKIRPVYAVGIKPGSLATRYAYLLQFGRKPNANGKGRIRPTRFMSNALESTREGAVRIFANTFGPAVEKSAARIAARQRKRAGR